MTVISFRILRVLAVLAAGGAMGAGGLSTAAGQAGATRPVLPGTTLPSPDPRGMDGGLSPSSQEKLAVARNDERMKRLQADTAQLLTLATKLKEDVDKTDKYTLSLDVVKRAAEIERLAKAIKDREKQ
jgi:hypothetical protein